MRERLTANPEEEAKGLEQILTESLDLPPTGNGEQQFTARPDCTRLKDNAESIADGPFEFLAESAGAEAQGWTADQGGRSTREATPISLATFFPSNDILTASPIPAHGLKPRGQGS